MKKLNSVIEAQQFDKETIEKIFSVADEMRKIKNSDILKGKIMASLFYEPSTRTRMSFESAMHRLGGNVISTENASEFSSAAKGETIEDSARVISKYADVIILRYPNAGGARRAADSSSVPVINAGDGAGQHPTQALLDLYTIKRRFGEISDLDIAMAGDLQNGRTVRSLCYFIAKHYQDNKVLFVSPREVRMNDDIKQYLEKYGVEWEEHDDFDGIIKDLDIIYQTRVQKERFSGKDEYEKVMNASKRLHITKDLVKRMKPDSIIMHPLPRVNEISPEVDGNSRAHYFEQAENGLYIRMALLKMMLEEESETEKEKEENDAKGNIGG